MEKIDEITEIHDEDGNLIEVELTGFSDAFDKHLYYSNYQPIRGFLRRSYRWLTGIDLYEKRYGNNNN